MAKYQLLLPKMGESVAEATIIKWNKNPGDYIDVDEAVMEIATDKVDSEVPSPVPGKLIEQLCNENDVVQVGAVIAVIETEEAGEIKEEVAEPAIDEPTEISIPEAPAEEPIATEPIPGIEQLDAEKPVEHINEFSNSTRFYSPLVKNIAAQEGINVEELDKIPGTGAEGRLTKDDLLNYLQHPSFAAPQSASPKATPEPVREIPVPSAQPEASIEPEISQTGAKPGGPKHTSPIADKRSDEIIEMDRMRKLIADHMVMSKQTSPHVTSFVEADVTNLVLWREKNKSAFEKREGEKITFTPIFIEAVARAIKDMPMINVSVNGNQIIKKANINIGMATALPSGNLIVPVIKNADELNLVGLTKAVNDLANRARNNKLQPDDVQDGTFTMTNVGSFGNIMGTPIINQPQAAILAVGAIKKKPAVIETRQGDVIAIRHLMFLSLSYDHRVVDGALGGSFLRKVADYLEAWDIDRAV